MKRLHLEPEEKAALEERHTSQNNGKERDRLKAILLRSEGWTVPQISQALRLHQSTVIRHVEEYKSGKLKNQSGGSSSHLTDEQTQALIAHLEEHSSIPVKKIAGQLGISKTTLYLYLRYRNVDIGAKI